MNEIDIKDLTLELLKDSPIEAELESTFALFEKAQRIVLSLCDINDEKDLAITKIGTILSLNLFGLLLGGKKIEDISDDDWKSIANEVIDKAVLMDGQSYSVYIFDLYAEYIENSADVLKKKLPGSDRQEQINVITALAKDLRSKKEQLENGEITEVAYTDDCLWISLDAMIKCMAAYIGCFTGEDLNKFIQGAASFAFEYGRLVLYQKEQALLEEYIQNQYLLDDQLQVKFDAYMNELNEEAAIFNNIINNAFDTDIRAALSGSVELARSTGVKEEEILKTTNDIDDFFLN